MVSAPLTWPYVAVHGMLLNTGKVLTWQRRRLGQVLDPTSGSFVSVPLGGTNLLCAGQTLLPTVGW